MKKLKRLCDIAIEVAKTSEGVGGSSGKNFKVGAVLYNSSGILATGINSYRTSPRLIRYYLYPHYHAEALAILRAGFRLCKGASLVVARIRKDGSLGLSKPCGECQKLIKLTGIRSVLYSTPDGFYEL